MVSGRWQPNETYLSNLTIDLTRMSLMVIKALFEPAKLAVIVCCPSDRVSRYLDGSFCG